MFDIIGFWFGVTVFSYSLLIIPVFILVFLCSQAVNWASRGRFASEIGNFIEWKLPRILTFGNTNTLYQILLFAVAAVILLFSTIVYQEQDYTSVVTLVSDAATFFLPVTKTLSALVIFVGGGAFLARKCFDAYFSVKEKLDKLKDL